MTSPLLSCVPSVRIFVSVGDLGSLWGGGGDLFYIAHTQPLEGVYVFFGGL